MITRKYVTGKGIVYEWVISKNFFEILMRGDFIFETWKNNAAYNKFWIYPRMESSDWKGGEERFGSYGGDPYEYYLDLGIPIPNFIVGCTGKELDRQLKRAERIVDERMKEYLNNRELPLERFGVNIGKVVLKLEDNVSVA